MKKSGWGLELAATQKRKHELGVQSDSRCALARAPRSMLFTILECAEKQESFGFLLPILSREALSYLNLAPDPSQAE